MATGTVKWFSSDKGYGFIQPDAFGPDVFVHTSALEQAGLRSLNEGQKISYEFVADKRSGKARPATCARNNSRLGRKAAMGVARDAGATHYLAKPFEAAELGAKISRLDAGAQTPLPSITASRPLLAGIAS